MTNLYPETVRKLQMKRRLVLTVLLCTPLFWPNGQNNSVYAQTGATKGARTPYVAWVSQFPEVQDSATGSKFFNQLSALLLGKRQKTRIGRPMSVVAEKPSDLWVLDQGNRNLFNLNHDKLRSSGAMRRKGDAFSSLVGLCFTSDRQHLLFTDSRENRIYAFDNNESDLSYFGDSIKLNQPTGIAYNRATGETWVTETGSHDVVLLDKGGALVKRLGSRGTGPGEFNFPTAVWIDSKGDAYVVDAMNFRIQIFDKHGGFITSFGELGDRSGYMARPKGVATDTYGNIYVSDAQFNVVQVFDRAGEFLYRFGKMGKEPGEFWLPGNIYIDENNYIYVADTYNSRVQVFQLKNGG